MYTKRVFGKMRLYAQSVKYIKEKTKTIYLRFKTEEYEQNIYPVIQKTGLPVATHIKQAIREKMERDNNK